MRKLLCVFVLLCAALALTACGKKNVANADVTLPPVSEQTSAVTSGETAEPVSQPPTEMPTEYYTEAATEYTQPATEPESTAASAAETTAPAESTTQHELKKTGEMEFSDSAENKYLAAVAKKYGLEPSRLAAIYTVPDNNGNIVLYFDGTTDESGRLVRTADTLAAIYTIDAQMNSQCASENDDLNEYPYGEMKVMYFTVTKHIMPQFEKELNG